MTSTELKPILSTNRWLFLPADVLVRVIWQARFRIMFLIAFFSVLGILVALLLPSEFRAEARIMPEMNTGTSDLFKRLSSVAAFADLDLSDTEGTDAVRPDLYPNVLQSTPFVLHLIRQPISTGSGQTTTVEQFLLADAPNWSLKNWLSPGNTDKDKQVLPGKLKGAIRLSARQQELAEEIGERVSARLDTRSGIITIIVQMPDAQVAALVAQLTMDYLTQYVTSYRTEKSRQDLTFYNQQLAEAHRRYQAAQFAVFQYNDNHKNLILQTATLDRHRLEAELTISQTVYAELSRQFEQAKLKVQERTPIFKVLEPPKVPLKRASPKRTIIVLAFALTGLLLGVVSALIRQLDLISQLKAIVADTPKL